MIYLKLRENSVQARAFLEYIKTIPFIEIVEKEQIPNKITLKALHEAEKGNLKRFKNVKDLMKDLKS